MLRRLYPLLSYKPSDVKSKIIFERALAAKVKSGVREDDVDHDALAVECGLLPPTMTNTALLTEKKLQLIKQLQEQKRKRISQREAFLEWQAGQREKGAAHRLLRQTKTAEKYKRRHYHSRQGRVLPVSHVTECQLHGDVGVDGVHDVALHAGCMTTSECLHGSSPPEHRVYVSLQRKW